MIKRKVKIGEITYTIRATTLLGLEDAERMLKKSLKRMKKQNKEEDDAI